MRYYPGFAHLFDDFFNDSISSQSGALKTDITEKDGMYILEMEVPGYKKEDIQIELDQGYLKVQASRSDGNYKRMKGIRDEKEEKGKYVRKERYVGTCSRSFYVGEGYKQEDIKASFDNGELKITLPTEAKKIEENKKMISIE